MKAQCTVEAGERFAPAQSTRHAALDALGAMEIAAALIGPTGLIQEATSLFARFGGGSIAELRGRSAGNILSAQRKACDPDIDGWLMQALANESEAETFPEPVELVRNESGLEWIVPQLSRMPVESEPDAVWLLMLRDVSELMQAQRASAESECKYREVVEHANSVILRIGSDFEILFINPFGLNFFGYANEELVGASLLDTVVPARDPEGNDLHQIAHRVAQAPELYGSYDQRNRCRNGEWVWVHWSVRAIRDGQGGVRELLCVGTDITERKHAEVEAEHYRQRAQRLAGELIDSEARERLRIAGYLHDNIIQMLSLSNIRLGGLLPELEHTAERLQGIRTLLEDAVGGCRAIMDQLVPPLLYELGVGAAVRHLAEKHQMLDRTDIVVDDCLGEIVLSREFSGLLFGCVRELLMNALKYAGSCRIDIALWVEHGRLCARVADNGCGFEAHPLGHAKYDDGGFGLFTIRERLESLGGVLNIDSSLGEGAAVCVSVPLPAH